MEHSGETGFPSSKSESKSSRLEDAAGPQQELQEGEHQCKPGYGALSYYQLKTAIEREARIYLSSKPGIDSAASNIGLHSSIIRPLKGTSNPDIDDLVKMRIN